jgi:hypothetical protein
MLLSSATDSGTSSTGGVREYRSIGILVVHCLDKEEIERVVGCCEVVRRCG